MTTRVVLPKARSLKTVMSAVGFSVVAAAEIFSRDTHWPDEEISAAHPAVARIAIY